MEPYIPVHNFVMCLRSNSVDYRTHRKYYFFRRSKEKVHWYTDTEDYHTVADN